jgi:hypothetical protein
MFTPTLTDYLTGEPIRPATREEWQRSTDAVRAGYATGTFDLDGRAVFVAGDFPTTDPGALIVLRDARPNGWILGPLAAGPRIGLVDNGQRDWGVRIVQCVNACAGMDNPAAVLAEVRAALTDARDRLAGMTGVPDPLPRVRAALALLNGGPKGPATSGPTPASSAPTIVPGASWQAGPAAARQTLMTCPAYVAAAPGNGSKARIFSARVPASRRKSRGASVFSILAA